MEPKNGSNNVWKLKEEINKKEKDLLLNLVYVRRKRLDLDMKIKENLTRKVSLEKDILSEQLTIKQRKDQMAYITKFKDNQEHSEWYRKSEEGCRMSLMKHNLGLQKKEEELKQLNKNLEVVVASGPECNDIVKTRNPKDENVVEEPNNMEENVLDVQNTKKGIVREEVQSNIKEDVDNQNNIERIMIEHLPQANLQSPMPADKTCKKEDVKVVGEKMNEMKKSEKARIKPCEVKDEQLQTFSCGYRNCRKSFTSVGPLASHCEKHYPTGSRIGCPFNCSYTSGFKKSLELHIRTKHVQENLFQCQICFLDLHSYKALLGHEATHKDPRKIHCSSCRRFFTKGNVCRCSNHQ